MGLGKAGALTVAVLLTAAISAGCSSYRASGGVPDRAQVVDAEGADERATAYRTSGGDPDRAEVVDAEGADERATARTEVEENARLTVKAFLEADPSMQRFLDSARGYAVFPRVGKGGVGIGAARGDGVVFEGGEIVGYTTLTQGTIGLQLGGQVYSQIIFFQDEAAIQRFQQGNMEFSAQASAVAAANGAAAGADFEEGVAIFVLPRTGLMFEASVGGQKFSYEAKQ